LLLIVVTIALVRAEDDQVRSDRPCSIRGGICQTEPCSGHFEVGFCDGGKERMCCFQLATFKVSTAACEFEGFALNVFHPHLEDNKSSNTKKCRWDLTPYYTKKEGRRVKIQRPLDDEFVGCCLFRNEQREFVEDFTSSTHLICAVNIWNPQSWNPGFATANEEFDCEVKADIEEVVVAANTPATLSPLVPVPSLRRLQQQQQGQQPSGLFVWCGQAFSSENVVSDDTKVLVLSCLRAVVQKSRTLKPESWQVEAAFKLATHPNEQVRVHSVGMLGFFAKMPHVGPTISLELGSLIVSLLSDASGWVIAEAFDVIFLVFDDLYDDVIVKVNLLQKMKEFEDFLKTKMRDPAVKADQLLFTKLDEVLANIDPFLEYKRQQQRTK